MGRVLPTWRSRFSLPIAIVVLCGLASLHFARGPARFDQPVWCLGETPEFSSAAPRLRMADGLIESGALIGKRRSEITTMLGPPSRTDYFENDLVYRLGAERGVFGIDREWLVIRFDRDRVADARIAKD